MKDLETSLAMRAKQLLNIELLKKVESEASQILRPQQGGIGGTDTTDVKKFVAACSKVRKELSNLQKGLDEVASSTDETYTADVKARKANIENLVEEASKQIIADNDLTFDRTTAKVVNQILEAKTKHKPGDSMDLRDLAEGVREKMVPEVAFQQLHLAGELGTVFSAEIGRTAAAVKAQRSELLQAIYWAPALLFDEELLDQQPTTETMAEIAQSLDKFKQDDFKTRLGLPDSPSPPSGTDLRSLWQKLIVHIKDGTDKFVRRHLDGLRRHRLCPTAILVYKAFCSNGSDCSATSFFGKLKTPEKKILNDIQASDLADFGERISVVTSVLGGVSAAFPKEFKIDGMNASIDMSKLELLLPLTRAAKVSHMCMQRANTKDLRRELSQAAGGGLDAVYRGLTAECSSLSSSLKTDCNAGIKSVQFIIGDKDDLRKVITDKLTGMLGLQETLSTFAVNSRSELAPFLQNVAVTLAEIKKDYGIDSVKNVRVLYRSAVGDSLYHQIGAIRAMKSAYEEFVKSLGSSGDTAWQASPGIEDYETGEQYISMFGLAQACTRKLPKDNQDVLVAMPLFLYFFT